MKRFLRSCLAFVAIALMLSGQSRILTVAPPTFIIHQAVSGAVAVVTVTLPANSSKYVNIVGIAVSCSGGCNLTHELTTNVATTTSATISNLRNPTDVPLATGWTASNITSAGVITHPYIIPSGTTISLQYPDLHLAANYSSPQSVTFRTDNATGTNGITVIWNETT